MNIQIAIKHDSSQVPVVGRMVRHLCVIADVGHHPAVSKIELAVVELLTNITGYSKVTSDDALIKVHCQFEGGDFSVTVSEAGKALSADLVREYSNDKVSMPGIDLGIDQNIESLPESGWGIQLIKSACDNVSYCRVKDKNVYELIFDLSTETA